MFATTLSAECFHRRPLNLATWRAQISSPRLLHFREIHQSWKKDEKGMGKFAENPHVTFLETRISSRTFPEEKPYRSKGLTFLVF